MDALLQEILDAPDDDEPRLVWADREGGERGELVVLQCMLARYEGTRADRMPMQLREREVLRRFTKLGVTYVRGFIESMTVPLAHVGPELFERAPLLRAIELENFMTELTLEETPFPGDAWMEDAERLRAAFATLPEGRLRSLRVPATLSVTFDQWTRAHGYGDGLAAVVANVPSLARLTELDLVGGNVTKAAFPHLAKLPLERLATSPRLTGEDLVGLLRAVATLRGLSLPRGQPAICGDRLAMLLAAPEVGRLRELDLSYNQLGEEDLVRLGDCDSLANLERLGLAYANITPRGWDAIAQSPHLEGLRALGLKHVSGFRLGMLHATRFRLREIEFVEIPDGAAAHFITLPDLERVGFNIAGDADWRALLETIPIVGYW